MSPFPAGAIAPNYARYDAQRNLNLTHCTFGDRCEIVLNSVDVDMSVSRCLGSLSINVASNGTHDLKCNNTRFAGHLAVEAGSQAGAMNFVGSQFYLTSKFQFIEQMRSLNFDRCCFIRAVVWPLRQAASENHLQGRYLRTPQ